MTGRPGFNKVQKNSCAFAIREQQQLRHAHQWRIWLQLQLLIRVAFTLHRRY